MAKKSKPRGTGATLDLHGMKEDEIFDAVDAFIRSPKVQNSKEVRIMPGKGKGIVRKKLIEYLKLGGFPWSFEKSSHGQVNEGVIIVIVG